MKLTFKKITASADQSDLIKALKKIEKLAGDIQFVDTLSTMDEDMISLVYYVPCDEEDYPEMGKDILKITKSVKDWSATTQYVKKEEAIQIKFVTKIGF